MLANFRLKIKQAGTPASKTDLLVFLQIKDFWRKQSTMGFLIYLKAFYEQKMKEIHFSTLATK